MKKVIILLLILLFAFVAFAKTKITITAPYGEMLAFLRAKVPEFTKENPDIDVEVIQEPEGGQIAALISAGNAPDIFIGVFGYMPEKYAAMNKLVNLKKLPGYEELAARIYTGLVESDDGGVYYIPWMLTTQMLIYNKALFEEAGLDPNKPPETFDEFLEYAKKIDTLPKRPDGSVVHGTVFWNDALVWGGWYWTMLAQIYYNFNNGQYGLFDEFGLDVVFDEPNAHFADFLKFCKEAQKYAPLTMEQNFFSRTIGMWLQYGYSWKVNLANAKDHPMEIGKDVGIAPIPVAEKGNPHWSTLDGRSLMIFKSTKDREMAAWKFIQFLMKKDINLEACKILGYLPSLEELRNDPYFSRPDVKPFVDQLQYAIPNEAVAQLDEVANILLSIYAEVVIKNTLTPEEAVKIAAQAAREALR